MTDALIYTQGMTDNQRMLFLSEYNQRKKDSTVGILLALFLGGLGAHRFYMGQIALGVLYLVFVWTLIPSIVAFVELFLMSGRVERHNAQVAQDVAAKVRIVSPAA